jgi:hypothetical protein
MGNNYIGANAIIFGGCFFILVNFFQIGKNLVIFLKFCHQISNKKLLDSMLIYIK